MGDLMKPMTWAGILGVLTLVSGAAEASPPRGNFYARVGANDAPIAGRFHIYAYFLDSLDTAVPVPGPGRILAVNFRGSNGKNAFVVPGDLYIQYGRKQKWAQGFCPLSEAGIAGLLGKDESRWALWWVPDTLAWNAPDDLEVYYGFARSEFVSLEDKDAEATLAALPWEEIHAATLVPDRPTSHVMRMPDPAAFDTAPIVRTRRAPQYPVSARAYDFQGNVHVVAHISDKGAVTDAYVIHSSATHILNVSALVAVMDWTFKPGKKGGVPVSGDMVIPVEFALGTVK
jgi:TonB family protein